MSRLIRGGRRVLVGLLPAGLLLVACTGAPGVSNRAPVAAPRAAPTAVVNLHENHLEHHATASDDAPVTPLTVNVYVTDSGIQPASIFIPIGQQVELVMRNVGATEHHFRVLGLAPRNLMRLTWDESGAEASDAEHAHHDGSLVPSATSVSGAGVRRSSDEVHAYAFAGGMDVIVFTPTTVGTFSVQCPLRPGMVGEVTVF